MNLSQLHYFQVVAEEEHISRAAEKLLISQPSLSTTIRRLEDELDTPLFDRRGRNIYLNHAGRQLLEHARFIFSQIDQLQKDLQEENFYIDHGLRMAVNNSSFLEGWLSDFIMQQENARITQLIASKDQMIEDLLAERIDLAIGEFYETPPEIASKLLLEDEYMVAIPPCHPLANKEALQFDDIRNEAFSSLSSNTVDCFIHIIFDQKGARPNIIFEGQLSLMLKLLFKGHALMFTSRHSWDMYMRHAKTVDPAHYEEALNVRVLPITDVKTHFFLSVCWKKDRPLPIMAQNLFDYLFERQPLKSVPGTLEDVNDDSEGGAQ